MRREGGGARATRGPGGRNAKAVVRAISAQRAMGPGQAEVKDQRTGRGPGMATRGVREEPPGAQGLGLAEEALGTEHLVITVARQNNS